MLFHYQQLEHQARAVAAVADVFAGCQTPATRNFYLNPMYDSVPNILEISDALLEQNIQSVQAREFPDEAMRPQVDNLNLRDIAVEMETGTGKTLTYLQTALELNRRYGLMKFIIVVPSVAIREGVLKTLKNSRDYLKGAYGNVNYDFSAYEGDAKRKITVLKDFVSNQNISFLVIGVQSFHQEDNIINQNRDDAQGRRMMEIIASTNPVVILDEPQNMKSELRKKALALLKPLVQLRYSATHVEPYNLVFALTPTDAYNQGLVKQVEIAALTKEDAAAFIFVPQKIETQRGMAPSAKVRVEVKTANGGYAQKVVNFKRGSDIERRTKNEKYKNLFVSAISARTRQVELSNGKSYSVGVDVAEDKHEIFKAQLEATIQAHFDKQQKYGDSIKVLSLIFIDKVANYIEGDGIIRTIFEERFSAMKQSHDLFREKSAEQVHSGYFSRSGTRYQDTSGSSKEDDKTYQLIMRDKERLLSFDEDVCFIFSHSALKEGWDNPNVFNICTLHETQSQIKKRQVIGRGMRLCVNQEGRRVHDREVNLLTVIANESYQHYIAELQQEFADAKQVGHKPPEQKARRVVRFRKQYAIDDRYFMALWKKISRRTTYKIKIDSPALIKKCVAELEELEITPPAIVLQRVQLTMGQAGVDYVYEESATAGAVADFHAENNICGKIADITGLTKKTVFKMIDGSDGWEQVAVNATQYIREAGRVIKGVLETVITDGIQYIPLREKWRMEQLFVDVESYEDRTIVSSKSVYDHVICDSDGERQFAESLQASRNVRVFAKLPARFIIQTPVGDYNPDWAIVWHEDGKDTLYLVRETKFVDDLSSDLRAREQQKIACARAHFMQIGVNFKVSKNQRLEDLL